MPPKMQEGDNDDSNRNIYIPFNTSSDLVDTKYLDSIWLDYRGDHEMVEKALRETMAAAHHFRTSDHRAMGVANLMSQVMSFGFYPSHCRFCLPWLGRSPWASPASA